MWYKLSHYQVWSQSSRFPTSPVSEGVVRLGRRPTECTIRSWGTVNNRLLWSSPQEDRVRTILWHDGVTFHFSVQITVLESIIRKLLDWSWWSACLTIPCARTYLRWSMYFGFKLIIWRVTEVADARCTLTEHWLLSGLQEQLCMRNVLCQNDFTLYRNAGSNFE